MAIEATDRLAESVRTDGVAAAGGSEQAPRLLPFVTLVPMPGGLGDPETRRCRQP